MASAFAYRKEIDGLRALAVLPVLFFHAGFEIFSGGFVGVDIFFVISGYLITSIILSEMQDQKFSLLKFYERRARRILPALCTVIICSALAAYFIMLEGQWRDFLQSGISVIFFASNIFFWLEDDYFAAVSEEKPLLHSWSLAVEEQYYIFFPIMIMALWRFGRNPMLYLIGFLAAISLISAEYGSRYYPSANFYLLFGRAWEILAGSMAAFYMRKPRHYGGRADLLSWLGLAMLCIAIFLFDKETPFPSLYAALPVLGTLMIIICARSDRGLGTLLSNPLCVGIGLISYSLYLWHQPVFAFGRLLVFEMGWMLKIGLIMVSIILAMLSYYIIEKPARYRWLKNEKPRGFFIKAMIIPLLLVAVFGLLLWNHTGPLNNGKHLSYAGADKQWNYVSKAGHNRRIILYGDSHARQYAAAIEDYTVKGKYDFELMAGPACISLPDLTNYYKGKISDECVGQLQKLREKNQSLTQNGAGDHVIIIAHRWGPLLSDLEGNIIGKIDSKLDSDNPQKAQIALFTAIRKTIDSFPASQKIIFIGNVPAVNPPSEQMERGPSRCRQYINGNCPMSFTREEGELFGFNQDLRAMLSTYPNAYYIDPYDSLCDAEKCFVERGKTIYYSDDAHLTDAGAQLIISDLKPIIDKDLKQP